MPLTGLLCISPGRVGRAAPVRGQGKGSRGRLASEFIPWRLSPWRRWIQGIFPRRPAPRGLGFLAPIALIGMIACGDQKSSEPSETESQQISGPGTGTPAARADDPFIDVTEQTNLDFVHFNGMTGRYYYSEMMGPGAALFDADNDGDLDLFLIQGSALDDTPPEDSSIPPAPGSLPLSDRLYLNVPSDTPSGDPDAPSFRWLDVTEGSGIPGERDGYGMGVAAADFDGDGWTDLFVTQTDGHRMLRNLGVDSSDGGKPKFEDITDEVTGNTRWAVPAVAFDADGDQDLDLFVCNYVAHSIAIDKNCPDELGRPNYCGPMAYPSLPDALLINESEPKSGLRFRDRSGPSGIDQESGACLGAAAADFNGDGKLDLYVANDGSPNVLWINQGDGRFENQALLAGAGVNAQGHAEASMGVAVADVDGDLDEDILLTHLARETHTLYVNDGSGAFFDRSAESGLAGPSLDRTGFGTAFFDYDHDGLLDAVVAAGAVKILKELALAGDPHPLHQRNQLYRGVAPGRFEDVTDQAGAAFAVSEVTRSAVIGDLDNDGDLDLVLTNNAGPARVLLNRVGQDRPWIGLRLVSEAGSDVPGASATVQFGDGRQVTARIGANAGYASTGDPRLSFPVGSSSESAGGITVTVRWPDGSIETWSPGPANKLSLGTYSTLTRGSGTAVSSKRP